ncbi:MAG: hypothetical protein COW70_11960, partial [Hydrogenophilales bacterium CG18_big_fil_WC_8_21_14_2_50_58_12]
TIPCGSRRNYVNKSDWWEIFLRDSGFVQPLVQAIEFETTIDPKGHLHLPEKYRNVYGKYVRLMVLLPQTASEFLPGKTIDPMKYSNTFDWAGGWVGLSKAGVA